jgi:hypothetical protein
LKLLRIGDLDRPALALERFVDDPGAGHRLNDSADRFAVDLLDPPRQRSQRVDVGRGDELIEPLTSFGEQADVELSPTEI